MECVASAAGKLVPPILDTSRIAYLLQVTDLVELATKGAGIGAAALEYRNGSDYLFLYKDVGRRQQRWHFESYDELPADFASGNRRSEGVVGNDLPAPPAKNRR